MVGFKLRVREKINLKLLLTNMDQSINGTMY